jgi:nitrogen fixation NifU-like protein
MSKKLTKEEFELLKVTGYSEKAIEYYVKNVNVGIIENPDVTMAHTGPCGDTVGLYLKINKNGIIEDAKFLYLGCPGLAASGSALTKLMMGKTIREARKITENDILKDLGGLSESKLDCPKLAITTLQKAILKYREQKD